MYASPFDLLLNSADEQDVIRCLIGQPDFSAIEIASATKIPHAEVEKILSSLLSGAKIIQHCVNVPPTYSVNFAAPKQIKNKKNDLLESLFI